MTKVRAAVDLPLLCKDFVIYPFGESLVKQPDIGAAIARILPRNF